jgi:zinc protease
MLDRKTPPPFVHTTSFDLLHPVKKKLPNGVELFFVSGGSQEVIKIELVFPAGRWYESVPGAAYFTGNLLSKGTAKKSSFEIAQTFDRFGAHLEVQPGLDFVSISVYGLTKYFTPVFDLLLELMREASFPEKELEQHKSIFIQNLKINEEKTSFLASKAFRKKLFGDLHPYGIELEVDDVQKIKQDDLKAHYSRLFNNLKVFVSGKIDSATEYRILDSFASFSNGNLNGKSVAASGSKSFHERIAKEGSVQASVRMGKKSVIRTHPDYASAIFVSHILGGYFGSRLMKNIREEKGLTYGIYASLHPLQHDAYLAIGTDVDKENIDITLDEIRKELKTLRTERINAEELNVAKNHFIGSFQAEITTPFAHADKIKTISLSDLGHDFYQNLILKIDAMTEDDILEISEKHFHESSFSDISVG